MRRSVRRLLILLPFAVALGVACSDDGGADAEAGSVSTTSTSAPATTTTEAGPVDSTFVAEDQVALCADLDGLGDIDPDIDPTQENVGRLLTIAASAPTGVAEPLRELASFGQAVVDGTVTTEQQTAAVEAATILIAYGNEACRIDVPLFDAIAGV